MASVTVLAVTLEIVIVTQSFFLGEEEGKVVAVVVEVCVEALAVRVLEDRRWGRVWVVEIRNRLW